MKYFSMIWAICVLTIMSCQVSGQAWKTYENPVEAGFDMEKLKEVETQLSKMRTASFMVVHKGVVVYTKGDISRRFMTHSMRKSFMSAMYGIYTDNGTIDLSSNLEDLNIDDLQGLTAQEKKATIQNLITARSGIYHPAAYEPRGMKDSRPQRGSKKPGESFFYNNWDFNTLLTILEQESGKKFFEDFVEKIAQPLGMEDLRSQDMRFRVEPELSRHPAYLFKMSARDLARFGQLYLNKGKWNKKQIVSKSWIEESTKAFTENPPGFEGRGGYGYLWWHDNKNFGEPAYYASGLGGHRIYIFPKSEIVIVHQVNSYLGLYERTQSIDDLVDLVLSAKTGKASKRPKQESLQVNPKPINQVNMSQEDFSKFIGDYRHPFFGEISVVSSEDKFMVKGEVLGNFRIFPVSESQFVIEDLYELPLHFEPSSSENPRGKSTTLTDERRRPQKFVIYY